MSRLEPQFMGGRCPRAGWVLSFSSAALETPSQTRPMARLLRDSRSNQALMVSELRRWARHLLRNTTVVVTGLSFRSNRKRPSLHNPGYLPGQQHARDSTGARNLRDALRKHTGEIHCPPRASTEQRLQRKVYTCVSSEYWSRGPGSTTLMDVNSGDKSRASLVGLSS